MLTYFVHQDGHLTTTRTDVPADVSLLDWITEEASSGLWVRFNHEIFVAITPEQYRVLAQHLEISAYVAEHRQKETS